MFVFLKKIEFYKDKSDREAIVIAAEGAEGGGGVLRVTSSSHVFPLWGPVPSTKFFPSPRKSQFPLFLREMGRLKSKNSLKFQLILKGILTIFCIVLQEFAIHDCKSQQQTTKCLCSVIEPLGEYSPFRTDETLMENLGGSREEPWWGFRRQSSKSFGISMSLRQLNGLKGLSKTTFMAVSSCFSWLMHQLQTEYDTTQRSISHPVAFVVF